MIFEKKYNYKQFYEDIVKCKDELKIPQSTVVALLGDYSYDFFCYFFALALNKCIIAPLLVKNLDFSLSDFGVEVVLNTSSKQLEKYNDIKNFTLLERLKIQSKGGLILFSSGSTGKPKAVVHDMENFLYKYLNKKKNLLKVAALFLPDHVAGVDVFLPSFSCGSCLVIPKTRNPKDVLETLEHHKVEILPSSATMLRLLMLSDLNMYNLNSLKIVIYGSETMDLNLLCSLKELLPHVVFKQSFGTSETNAVSIINHKDEHFKKYFKIVDCDYKIINNELYLKSKTQSLGYLNADNSAFDEEGYFATGDLVELYKENGEEYIKIIGRSKELINVGGEKVIPQEVEGVILELGYIQDCLVYAKANAITGQSVCVKVVLKPNVEKITNLELKKQLRLYCKGKLANYKIPTQVEIVDKLELSERFKKIRKV
ncbi:long-chain fatty acid--CoA ligase [Campylobacter jejuni]|nr:long-chain fatty acid--CoA ligase [Campylobacter jejuni]